MADFDPGAACSSFRPVHAGRGRRRANTLLFVAQATAAGEARFVVKDYAAPGDGPGEARARLQRELDGQAAFVAQGEAVLRPCAGPFEQLSLQVDGQLIDLGPSLVFPFLPAPTLFDVLREASAARGAGRRSGADAHATDEARGDAAALLVRAVGRMAARHTRARSVADLHSDGATHNILVVSAPASFVHAAPPADATGAAACAAPAPSAGPSVAPPAEPALLWFDFAEPHAARDVAEARAVELLAFLLSVVEASGAGEERGRVAAVCDAYPDRAVLARVLARRTPERPWSYALRHRLRLRSWLALRRGDTTQLARFRLLNALRPALARHAASAPAAPHAEDGAP